MAAGSDRSPDERLTPTSSGRQPAGIRSGSPRGGVVPGVNGRRHRADSLARGQPNRCRPTILDPLHASYTRGEEAHRRPRQRPEARESKARSPFTIPLIDLPASNSQHLQRFLGRAEHVPGASIMRHIGHFLAVGLFLRLVTFGKNNMTRQPNEYGSLGTTDPLSLLQAWCHSEGPNVAHVGRPSSSSIHLEARR
jgi:hypothetical protein